MKADGEIRLPLQIGTSSIWSLARASAALLGGPALAAVAASIVIETHTMFWPSIALGIAGILFFFFGWTHFRYALLERPSDVVLSPQGLRVEGGRHHGLAVSWSEVDRSRCTLDAEKERRLTLVSIAGNAVLGTLALAFETVPDEILRSNVEVLRLRVARTKGEALLIAEAERPIEKDSLRALFDSILAGHWYGAQTARARAGSAEPTAERPLAIVACSGCGAAATPDDAPTVACPYCGASVAMPDSVRAGVRDGRVIDHEKRRTGHLVSRLVAQPGARETNRLVAWAALPMVLAWPLAFWMVRSWWGMLGFLPASILVRPAFFALSAILAFFCLLRWRVVDRFALRMLTLGFGARAPEKPGAPYGCRRCGAPLAEVRDTILAPCVYCGTENVIGVDLGHRAAREAEQSGSLADALRSRSSERRLWGRLSAAALLLLVLDARLLWRMPVVVQSSSPVAAAESSAPTTLPVSRDPARVKGRYAEVNTGTFDLADGIAYAVQGATVVHVTSKPIASSVLADSTCPMTEAKALELLRSCGFIEMALDPRGRSAYFAAGTVLGGRSLENEAGGHYWKINGGKVTNGRIAGTLTYPKRGGFDFDLPLAAKTSVAVRRKPTEAELIAAYAAVHRAVLAKDLKAMLGAQGFDAKQIEAIAGLRSIDADFAGLADRFLTPGAAEEPTLETGMGRIGARGKNSKGKAFFNFYEFEPCGDTLALVGVSENPQ